MAPLLIIGTGGLAREFTSWFAADHDIVGYASTNRQEHADFGLPGRLFAVDVTPDQAGTDLAVVAIGSPAAKEQFHRSLAAVGFRFPSMVHSSSIVAATAVLEAGVVVSPHCVVGCNVVLGKLAYINFGCGIGHDARIGDFVQVNPGTQVGGGCRIGAGTLVGSGSTLLNGLRIGEAVTIGSGSAVFSSVESSSTMMGNPARRMRALESGS